MSLRSTARSGHSRTADGHWRKTQSSQPVQAERVPLRAHNPGISFVFPRARLRRSAERRALGVPAAAAAEVLLYSLCLFSIAPRTIRFPMCAFNFVELLHACWPWICRPSPAAAAVDDAGESTESPSGAGGRGRRRCSMQGQARSTSARV